MTNWYKRVLRIVDTRNNTKSKISMSKLNKIEIEKILKYDVQQIINAKEASKSIHSSGDTRAAGNEVEIKVREVIRGKLPLKYYVGHGHIVDENLNVSSQLDIIIADNSGSPVLLKSQDGTEYFPYESIYAFGEIKSTYYSAKKPIEAFIENTKNIYENLQRMNTSPNQITQDLILQESTGIKFQRTDKRPYLNPLFKFMFFVSSNDFNIEALRTLFKETDSKYLPNVICLLDQCVIVSAIKKSENGEINISLFPEYEQEIHGGEQMWIYYKLGDKDFHNVANFAFLMFALNKHLKECLVLRPDFMSYFKGMFKTNSFEIF